MASRKVYMNLTIKVVAMIDEGTEVSDFVNELDYNISDGTGNADICCTEITNHEVTDSK